MKYIRRLLYWLYLPANRAPFVMVNDASLYGYSRSIDRMVRVSDLRWWERVILGSPRDAK